MLRLIGLVRVSGQTQAREGYGLAAQEQAIRAWARHSKLERVKIIGWAREEGISGAAPLVERDGLVSALGMIRAEQADGIVVAALDRLSRDVIVQEQVWREVTGLGGVLRSTLPAEDHSLVHDPSDPARALVRRIFASISAYERDMLRLRLSAGRAAKMAAGGYCHGAPPYGWKAIRGDLVPHETEQKVIRQMKARHDRGQSLRTITEWLNTEQIPTKMGRTVWSANSVRQVLLRSDRPRQLNRTTARPLIKKPAQDHGQPPQHGRRSATPSTSEAEDLAMT